MIVVVDILIEDIALRGVVIPSRPLVVSAGRDIAVEDDDLLVVQVKQVWVKGMRGAK
jgi:hypothetical protein